MQKFFMIEGGLAGEGVCRGAWRCVEGAEGSEGRVCLCIGLRKSEFRPSVLVGRVELGFKFFCAGWAGERLGDFRGRAHAPSVVLLI